MGLGNEVKLNRVYNEIQDLLNKENVDLEVFGYSAAGPSLSITEGQEVSRLYFNDATRTYAFAQDQPPKDFDAFLAKQTDIHVAKNTDYGSRYIKALVDFGSVIWTWEVQKKLDRIRSWLTRGELLVKGEGVNNSVGDLFNYTVQYQIYNKCINQGLDPAAYLGESEFYAAASEKTPEVWVTLLTRYFLIQPEETELQQIILRYMGVKNA